MFVNLKDNFARKLHLIAELLKYKTFNDYTQIVVQVTFYQLIPLG